MTKTELVQKISDKLGCSKKEAQGILEAVFGSIVDGCKNDGIVQISGVGTFKKKVRAARMGYRPGTREMMQYPESVNMSFKAGKQIKESLR